MGHDYRDMMKKGVCDEPAPLGNGGDSWKLFLGILAVLLFLGLVIK